MQDIGMTINTVFNYTKIRLFILLIKDMDQNILKCQGNYLK